MKTATIDFGIHHADIGVSVRPAEFRARAPAMPGQQPRGSQNALVPTGAPGVFQMRNNVLCVARSSERGLVLAESGAKKKAVLMTGDGQVFDIYSENHKKGGISMDQTGKRTTGRPAAAPGLGSGVVDSNRFYSMLLDARSANVTVTESMHDVAEKLLMGEKDNAKLALDQLWTLKKALTDAGTDETIEDLIEYYQNKIDALREREETIKKVSKETRALIEEKKRRDEELAVVKSQIGSHTRDLKDLNAKLEILKKREVELSAAEQRLREEITANESRIVGGLYDIILRRPDDDARGVRDDDPRGVHDDHRGVRDDPRGVRDDHRGVRDDPRGVRDDDDTDALDFVTPAPAAARASASTAAKASTPPAAKTPKAPAASAAREYQYYYEDDAPLVGPPPAAPQAPEKKQRAPEVINKKEGEAPAVSAKKAKVEVFAIEPVVYPKSVVRMGGKVIGEYYHDGNVVNKEDRHYIYNSRFIAERLSAGVAVIKSRFNQEIHAELIKIVEDAASRVRENGRFHFEVSTNEILNDKNLKTLISDLRRRVWEDAERFAARLSAKIEALGTNYEAMLQEQMERCAEND